MSQRGAIDMWAPILPVPEVMAHVSEHFPKEKRPKPGVPTADNPRTGAYKKMVETGHDLHELHALIAPRPFLVSGGSEDPPSRWIALNHAVAVNKLLGQTNRVAMANRNASVSTSNKVPTKAWCWSTIFSAPDPNFPRCALYSSREAPTLSRSRSSFINQLPIPGTSGRCRCIIWLSSTPGITLMRQAASSASGEFHWRKSGYRSSRHG